MTIKGSVADTLSKPELHHRWIKSYRNKASDDFIAEVIGAAIKAADLPLGAKVLDAGCGSGTNSVRLAQHGLSVTGVDFSEFVLEKARERAGASGHDDISLLRADLLALPFEDQSFDAVFCIGVLMHIPDFKTALSEMKRVLKPGGKLVLSEVNENSPEQIFNRFYYRFVSTKQIAVHRLEHGTELWSQTESGPLLARRMNLPWFRRYLREAGLDVCYQRSGALTELFRRVNTRMLQSMFIGLNRVWFRLRGPSALSTGVVIIAKKRS